MLKSILNFFFKEEKKKLYLITILSIISAFLDILGIVSIYPLIGILTNPELIIENFYLKNFLNFLGFYNLSEMMMISVLIFILIIIFSLLFKIISSSIMFWFVLSMESSLSIKVLENYLTKKYKWFIENQSSDLNKNILSEVGNLVTGVLLPTVYFFSNLFMVILISISLFYVDFKITIQVFLILGLSYLFVFNYFKKKLNFIGLERFRSNKSRFSIVNEAFNLFREVKLFDLEQKIINEFEEHSKNYAKSNIHFSILYFVPKLIIEIILVIIFGILILLLKKNNIPINDKLPILSLFLFAGYRLLPAIQQMYASFTKIKFYYSSLITLKSNIYSKSKIKSYSKVINFNKIIYLKNIKFKYPSKKNFVINNLSIKIKKNSAIGIYGKTGSGKSTFVDILSGLLQPISGKFLIDKKQILYDDVKSLQKLIGYVPQFTNLYNKTIIQNIAISDYPKIGNLNKIEEILKKVHLYNFIRKLPNSHNTKVGDKGIKLSGGQRQRIGIARALYKTPKILILDESTNSLDSKTENSLLKNIYMLKKQITIIFISHNLKLLSKCDRIYEFKNGKLYSKK